MHPYPTSISCDSDYYGAGLIWSVADPDAKCHMWPISLLWVVAASSLQLNHLKLRLNDQTSQCWSNVKQDSVFALNQIFAETHFIACSWVGGLVGTVGLRAAAAVGSKWGNRRDIFSLRRAHRMRRWGLSRNFQSSLLCWVTQFSSVRGWELEIFIPHSHTFFSLYPSISPCCSLALKQSRAALGVCFFLLKCNPLHFAIRLLMPAPSAAADEIWQRRQCVYVCVRVSAWLADAAREISCTAMLSAGKTHTHTLHTFGWYGCFSALVDLPPCCTVWGLQMPLWLIYLQLIAH